LIVYGTKIYAEATFSNQKTVNFRIIGVKCRMGMLEYLIGIGSSITFLI